MPTAAENLTTALENASARLAELDAVPITDRAKMTYKDGDQSYGWNEFRAALVAQVKELTDLIGKVRIVTLGPFNVHTGSVRG